MRVYFLGAHATGKTTLCRYVSNQYKLPMLTEVARTILSERELSLDSLRVDMDLVDHYQDSVIKRQIEEEKKSKSFVSDRSFDCIAYLAQHTRILKNTLALPELATYIEGLRQQDVYLFFVRPSKGTLRQDGVRETLNWDGIVQIDAMCKFLLEMYDLPYFQISMESMQERVKFIDSVLKKTK